MTNIIWFLSIAAIVVLLLTTPFVPRNLVTLAEKIRDREKIEWSDMKPLFLFLISLGYSVMLILLWVLLISEYTAP